MKYPSQPHPFNLLLQQIRNMVKDVKDIKCMK